MGELATPTGAGFRIQFLIVSAFYVIWADASAVVGVVVLWTWALLGNWASALARLCVENLSRKRAPFGYIRTLAPAGLPIKQLCFCALRCMRALALARVFVKNLRICASWSVGTCAFAL